MSRIYFAICDLEGYIKMLIRQIKEVNFQIIVSLKKFYPVHKWKNLKKYQRLEGTWYSFIRTETISRYLDHKFIYKIFIAVKYLQSFEIP